MALRQTVAQMGQPVARVGQRLLTQTVVSGQQLRQIGQLTCKRLVLTSLRCIEQRFGRNRTGLALVDQPQRFPQQFWLVGKAAPHRQAALYTARSLLQGQQLASRRQHLLRQTAHLGKNAVGQPRKRQHLGRARAMVLRSFRQAALHAVRVQFRHQKHLSALLFSTGCRNFPQDRRSFAA